MKVFAFGAPHFFEGIFCPAFLSDCHQSQKKSAGGAKPGTAAKNEARIIIAPFFHYR
jgi:hypothetical protein